MCIETVFVPVHRLAVLTDWRFPSSFSDPALLPGYLSGLMVRVSDKSFCSDPSWIPEFFPHRFIPQNNILIHDVMMSHKLWISNQLLFNSLSISTQLSPSPQLILPEGAQPRMWHTATALSLGPGWTQVTVFGGSPKLEGGKSDNAQQKLAKTTVLDFGEHNTYNSIHSFAVSGLFISCTTSDLPNQDKQNS